MWVRVRPFRSLGAHSRGVWMWSGTGACGQGSRPWAREAGSAQTRLHPHGCGCVWQARPLRTTTERRQCSPPVHRGSADRTGGDARQRAGRLRQGPEPAGEMRGRSGQKPPNVPGHKPGRGRKALAQGRGDAERLSQKHRIERFGVPRPSTVHPPHLGPNRPRAAQPCPFHKRKSRHDKAPH